jgi:hypothetical protein
MKNLFDANPLEVNSEFDGISSLGHEEEFDLLPEYNWREHEVDAFFGGFGSASQECFPSGECLPIVTGKPEGREQEYWDPNNSGNPLLDTSAAHRNLMLSPHFKVREFAGTGDVARIDPKLVECLEKIRVAVGKPVKITSGYRSWGYNSRLYRQVYKKRPTLSQHCSGRAADIRITGMSGNEIARTAIDICGCNIGVGIGMGSDRNGVHIDVRGQWARWGYGPQKAQYASQIEAYHRQRC